MSTDYSAVNAGWPKPVPQLTGPEAASAAKRLYRKFMGKPWKGKVRITSGNRYSYIRGGVLFVNPDGHHRSGWSDLVHDLSHYMHRRLHPNQSPHGSHHRTLETEMVAHVVKSGWLAGALQRPEKPKDDPREIRFRRVLARIKAWEAKERRAKTALKKLERTRAYYERTLG